MECSETREKTPSKCILENIHNKLELATCDKSPMWENHKFSTPKSKVQMAKNPFEPLLYEVMHTNIMSPSVFAALPNKAPIDNDKFCWSIEELASFQPVDLEKSPLVQSEATDHVLEAVTQAKINKFFSAKTILPSPAGPATDATPLIASSSSPLATPSPPAFVADASTTGITHMGQCQKRRKLCATIGCQTNLSLPMVLPEALECLLRPYMKHDALGQLMGQLCPDGYRISEGLHHSPMKVNLNPLLAESPSKKSLQESRFSDENPTNNWELSPISQDEDSGESCNSMGRCMRSRRSVAKLDFSAGHMSVDISQQLCWSKNSMHLDNTPKKPVYSESSPSPGIDKQLQSESIGNDSSFSRMEDDYISFHRSRNASFEAAGGSGNVPNFDMDISFSNTPKSRSASASRRRLCDSFASFGDDEEEDSDGNVKELEVEKNDGKENDICCDETLESGSPEKYKPSDLVRKHNEISSLTDAGYNTASTLEESSLYFERNTILFASTPTKAKIPFWPINE